MKGKNVRKNSTQIDESSCIEDKQMLLVYSIGRYCKISKVTTLLSCYNTKFTEHFRAKLSTEPSMHQGKQAQKS